MDASFSMLSRTRSSPGTILVVDDAPQNVKLLQLILKDAGYQVLEAFSGAEALDKLRSEKPDVMVLDVRMPGMSGYQVCEAVRRDPEFAALPVIMVTALSLPEERIKGIQAGATDFITKPFIKKELLARIETSLGLPKSGQGGITRRLPAACAVTAADWTVLLISPEAAAWLGVAGSETDGVDLRDLLQRRGVSPPVERSATSVEPWTFELPAPEADQPRAAKLVPITTPAGVLLLHVLVLEG
jgi:DNA-binding response OmpR family regulator